MAITGNWVITQSTSPDFLGSLPLTTQVEAGGGTGSHPDLTEREEPNQHPMEAITGLIEALTGRPIAKIFTSVEEMVQFMNYEGEDGQPTLIAGQSVLIKNVDVPDVWIGEIATHATWYDYHGDASFVEALNDAGSAGLGVGWYKLLKLESDYATKEQVMEILSRLDDVEIDAMNAVHYTAETKTASEKAQARENIGAISSTNAELGDPMPIVADNLKGISSATVGQFAKIKTVDENGNPTEWEGAEAGGSSVVANPTLAGTETALTGLEVDGVKYSAGGGKLYQHAIRFVDYQMNAGGTFVISNSAVPFTKSSLRSFLYNAGYMLNPDGPHSSGDQSAFYPATGISKVLIASDYTICYTYFGVVANFSDVNSCLLYGRYETTTGIVKSQWTEVYSLTDKVTEL